MERMRVFVSGGAGFLGSHVCEHFRNQGHDVLAYDSLTKFEIMRSTYDVSMVRDYNVNFLKDIGAKLVIADIRDKNFVKDAMKGSDLVIHCAAQPAMTVATENPCYDFGVNCKGTLYLLDCARGFNIPFLNISSIHVYGTGINDEIYEKANEYSRDPVVVQANHATLTGSITPLHASKIMTEIYTRTFAESYDMKAATMRLTGIYGERQCGTEDHAWMSLLAIKTLLGKPIEMIGTGKQVRDPIYVKDVVKAIDCWVKAGYPAKLYNIGGGTKTRISIIKYLELLHRITGLRSELVWGAKRKGDLYYYVSDIVRAQGDLKWQPETNLGDGVEKLVLWLSQNIKMFGG